MIATMRPTTMMRMRRRMTNADGCGIGELVEALHPTPAVCGLPKQEAIDFITANESIDRKYYSGYCGPWNVGGKTALFVSLRCIWG